MHKPSAHIAAQSSSETTSGAAPNATSHGQPRAAPPPAKATTPSNTPRLPRNHDGRYRAMPVPPEATPDDPWQNPGLDFVSTLWILPHLPVTPSCMSPLRAAADPVARTRLEPRRKIRRERSHGRMEAAEAACIRRHPRPRGRWLDRWQRSGRKGVRRHAAPGWHARLVGNKRLQRPNHWACDEVPVRQGDGRNTSHPAMRATRHGVVGTARIRAATVGGLAQAMAGGHAGGGHRHPRDNQSQSDDHGNHETAQPVQHHQAR